MTSPARDGEAVEAVAKAIARADGHTFADLRDKGDGWYWGKDEFRKMARAAIRTLLARGWLPKEGE